MNALYPLYWKLAGQPVLVAGGGAVARRRIESLLGAGARLTVVSPELEPEITALAHAGRLRWEARSFALADLAGAAFVFFATGDRELARRARDEAARLRIPFHAAEDEALSDFHVPAVSARGPVQVAVSTAGLSPA